MGQHLELAKRRLFDPDALGVTNVKFFPGTSRDITSEDLAEQVTKAISQIEANYFELGDLDKPRE